MIETWRPVIDIEGYEVSDFGRVRSYRGRGRGSLRVEPHILVPVVRGGYPEVRLMRARTVPIHTLVLETFVGPRPEGLECRHLNGNPLDGRLENLRWGTRSENYADRRDHGTANDGQRHGNATIDNVTARAIYAADGSHSEVAERFGVSVGQVSKIKRGEGWRRITGARLTRPGRAGENNGRARLTEADVIAIRVSSESRRALAKQYDVHPGTIAMVQRHDTWRHVRSDLVACHAL